MTARPRGRPPSATARRRQRGIIRYAYLLLALTSLAVGIVGIFVPVLPTVPFLLLAAWAAGRSSPRLEHWLETHPRYGPPVRAWRERGAVSRKAKWAATTAMSVSAVVIVAVVRSAWAAAPIAVMALVLQWLWRRPEG